MGNDYYAARAPEYDAIYQKPERQHDLRKLEHWLPGVFQRRSTLEVACGTGYWTQFIAREANGVVALDASSEVLRVARAREACAGVSFVLGDAYRLPIAHRSFEAAFAGFWLSHVPRMRVREFLVGLHRSLIHGAKVVLIDNRFVQGSSTPIAGQDDDGNTFQRRTLKDGSTHRVLKNFPSESALREVVAGLASEVRVHEWQYFWALEYEVDAS